MEMFPRRNKNTLLNQSFEFNINLHTESGTNLDSIQLNNKKHISTFSPSKMKHDVNICEPSNPDLTLQTEPERERLPPI